MVLIKVSKKGRLALIRTEIFQNISSKNLYSILDNQKQDIIYDTTNKEEAEKTFNRLERSLESNLSSHF